MIKIIVLGSNFAGATAAFELKRKLNKAKIPHDITVISATDQFLYVPSLIWVPFGKREISDITFSMNKIFQKKEIHFRVDAVQRIEAEKNQVVTQSGQTYDYDYLVTATGCSVNFDVVPGLNNTECIVTPPLALKCRTAFENFVKDPGTIIVGATPFASCMGAAYEFLFNLEKELRLRGVRKKSRLIWITPEPELGHFGIGGIMGGEMMLKAFMQMFDIEFRTNARIEKVEPHLLYLAGGEKIDFKMSMIIPSFEGATALKNSPTLTDDKGYIACHETYQSEKFENVYAAGLAVQVKSPFTNCVVPFGVPKTGFPSDIQGKIVAHNIFEKIRGTNKFKEMAFGKIPGICIMDAGHKEVWILTDHLFKPRRFEVMIPNVLYNFGKIFLEKYMLFKNRNGLSWLP